MATRKVIKDPESTPTDAPSKPPRPTKAKRKSVKREPSFNVKDDKYGRPFPTKEK